eukprot:185538_1
MEIGEQTPMKSQAARPEHTSAEIGYEYNDTVKYDQIRDHSHSRTAQQKVRTEREPKLTNTSYLKNYELYVHRYLQLILLCLLMIISIGLLAVGAYYKIEAGKIAKERAALLQEGNCVVIANTVTRQ